ncbi:MAG: NAD-dependent deacylase [Archaeoglobaceae archaeon]|nr:NAD-dependent deacylase [Archaeoglobales archaeon]
MESSIKDLIKRAAEDLANSKYAVAFTGAGISTESGIPDFRGPSGIWTRDPEAERRSYEIFGKFLRNPKEYWEEALRSPFFSILEQAKPNPAHYALAELEEMGIIKAVITQNIDALHQKAGSKNVLEFHGGITKLRCIYCGCRFPREDFSKEIEEKRIPMCKECGSPLKMDVVYFTEPIPRDVYELSFEEAMKCDLMLVCGTSAVVYPAAELPRVAKRRGAKVIEVNFEETPLTHEMISDYLIEGKVGEILPKIVEEVKKLRERQ